jgi:hypothetical protein
MKLFAFLVALILFLGSFLLFGYAFSAAEAAAPWIFFAGIAAVSLALVIPFHLLQKTD